VAGVLFLEAVRLEQAVQVAVEMVMAHLVVLVLRVLQTLAVAVAVVRLAVAMAALAVLA
jgi:hypothetical protein